MDAAHNKRARTEPTEPPGESQQAVDAQTKRPSKRAAVHTREVTHGQPGAAQPTHPSGTNGQRMSVHDLLGSSPAADAAASAVAQAVAQQQPTDALVPSVGRVSMAALMQQDTAGSAVLLHPASTQPAVRHGVGASVNTAAPNVQPAVCLAPRVTVHLYYVCAGRCSAPSHTLPKPAPPTRCARLKPMCDVLPGWRCCSRNFAYTGVVSTSHRRADWRRRGSTSSCRRHGVRMDPRRRAQAGSSGV
jgi:hypothetical protein